MFPHGSRFFWLFRGHAGRQLSYPRIHHASRSI